MVDIKSAKAPMVPAGGVAHSPAFNPGVHPGPFSPGEGANLMQTPDCPKSEAAIAQMEKK